MAQLIAAAAAGASVSSPVVVRTRRHVTVMAVPALAGAETGVIQISPDNGITWMQSAVGNLDVSNTTRRLDTPGIYRVSKGASVTATAIYASTEENA